MTGFARFIERVFVALVAFISGAVGAHASELRYTCVVKGEVIPEDHPPAMIGGYLGPRYWTDSLRLSIDAEKGRFCTDGDCGAIARITPELIVLSEGYDHKESFDQRRLIYRSYEWLAAWGSGVQIGVCHRSKPMRVHK